MDEQKTTTPITPELTKGRGEKKWLVGGLIGFVVILMITATALLLKLTELRPSPATPTVKQVEGEGTCEATITVVAPEPPVCPLCPLVCYEECDIADDLCATGLECTNISGVYRCVNPGCSEEESCVCEEEELICPDVNWVVQCRICKDANETDCVSWMGQTN